MKKLFKIIAVTIAVVALLALTATTLLGLFVDPNDFKKEIQQAALDNADLDLKINGDISWSIYPSIGLDIQSISASYANKEALASLEQAQVSVMVAPLLSGKLAMKAINIHGLTLNLVKDQAGNNWQPTTQAATDNKKVPATDTTGQTDSPASNESAGIAIHDIEIQSISLSDAKINYQDKNSGQLLSVNKFNLTTGRISSNAPFNAQLNMALAMEQSGKKTLSADIALEGQFNLDVKRQIYTINQLKSQLAIVTDQTIELALNGDVSADLKAHQLRVDNLNINAGKLNATGALLASGATFSDIEAKLAIQRFDLKALLQELQLSPIDTSEDASLRNISFDTVVKGNANALSFSDINLKLDKTNIKGSASYQLGSGLVGFNLQGDQVNISDYLPAAETQKQTAAGGTEIPAPSGDTTAYSKEQVIPIEALRDLKLKGQLRFKQLQYQQTNISNLALDIDANDAVVNVSKLNLDVYQGSIASSVKLDARKKPLRIQLKNKVNNLQIGPVLKDFAQNEAMTGTLSSNSQLSLSGQSVHSLVNSVTGKVNITLAKGVINGINAAQEMCQTVNNISSLGGTISTTQAVDKSTPFASIKGNFKLANGIVSNQDFNADLDAINAKGKGQVNLPKQSLNYRLGLNIKDNLFNKSCSVNNKIQGIEWPIDCVGHFSDEPLKLCKLDTRVIEKIAKKALEDKLKKKLETKLGGSVKEKKQELKEKVEDKLKNALKGLF